MDAATLERRWITRVEIPDEMSPYGGAVTAAVVGVLSGRLALEVSQDERHDLHVIDLTDGRVAWSRPEHGPSVVAGDVVVTVVDRYPDRPGSSLAGLAGADGRELWTDNTYGSEITVGPSGGGVAVVSGQADGTANLRLVDTADGKII